MFVNIYYFNVIFNMRPILSVLFSFTFICFDIFFATSTERNRF